jgi:hypothetical protein
VTCPTCADKGLLRLPWDDDAEPGIGVCLCAAGLAMRVNRNRGREVLPLWRVWCAREQVDPARVYLLEDVLSAEELAEEGLTVQPKGAGQDREAALLAAARKPARL